MKQHRTHSDIGAVLIGNEDWTFAVPNGIGDGTTIVRIYDSYAEFKEDTWAKGMTHFSQAIGTFGIFRYDCAYQDLLSHKMTIKNAVRVLKGRYEIFNKNGSYKVAFVKMEDN